MIKYIATAIGGFIGGCVIIIAMLYFVTEAIRCLVK